MKIVFDTYAWIEFFEGTKKGRIIEEHLEKDEILTPAIVLLELSYKADKEKWNFKEFLTFIKMNSDIVSFNDEFALSFGEFYNKMKKKIRDISFADVIILHTAKMHGAKVLTGDRHFNKEDCAIIL
ncbi:MAG: PIN domain-containing protein [Nanoarchaeota archaeon]|nr:PIN domain-containing protein [Nanoarchaeota archaeon]